MKKYTSLSIFLACVLGLFSGWLQIPFLYSLADGISNIFISLLKLVSLPIIFFSITSTITGMKSFQEMRTLGKKVLKLTLFTTLVAAAIALVFFLVIDPSTTAHSQLSENPLQKSYFSYLLQIVPSNFIQPFLENNVVAVAFIALFLSLATLKLKQDQKKTLHQFFSAFFAALLKMTSAIIPIGIWAFMTLLVKDLYSETLQLEQIFFYVCCIVGANLFQGLIVLPLLLKIKGISPIKTFRGMSKALFVAFFTKSSNATLPVAMKCAEENLGVSRKVSSFSFPLCSVINMNACAGFILITVLFVSQSHGMQFSGLEYLLWIFLATVAAIGNAGVPMGCFFLASAFLSGMNVPMQFMGMILPFYALLDMLETGINVWSDSRVLQVLSTKRSERPKRFLNQLASLSPPDFF